MLSAEAGVMITAAAVIFAAALLSSVAGFAFSALAGAALLKLFGDPLHAVGVMVVCSIAIQSYCVWALRSALEWRTLRAFVAGGALTVPLGVWLLTSVSPGTFSFALGTLVAGYGLYMLSRRRAPPPVLEAPASMDALVGALGGIVGGFAGFPGSFVTIWCGMRGWSKERQRAVYQPYILLMQLETIAFLTAGAPEPRLLGELVLYVPMALVAACMGLEVFRRLTARQFTLAVNVLLVASGLALLGASL